MKVGDLVYLNKEHFYEWDENIGIILEMIKTTSGELFLVAWDDGEANWFHEIELEVINGR